MVNFEEFQRGVGYEEKLRLVRAYWPHIFSAKSEYSLTKKGLQALTKKQKSTITRYYNVIKPFIGPTTHKVYTRSDEKASAGWRSLFGVEPPKGTRYVPVAGNAPRLVYYEESKGDLRAQVKDESVGITRHFFADYGINQKDLALDPATVLTELHEKIGGSRYSLLTGDHLLTRGGAVFVGSITDIIRQINYLQNRYGNERQSNHWREWMFGLQSYTFDDIDDFADYRNEEYESRKQRLQISEQLTTLNRSIKDTGERIQVNKDIIADLESELKYWLSGTRGKTRQEIEKRLPTVKKLKKKISYHKKLIINSNRTLATNIKKRQSVIKQLMKFR